MSIICIVVIGANNIPLYIKTRNMFLNNNNDTSLDINYLYELHSSLDIVEERQSINENRDSYLGLLNQNEDHKIYSFLSTTMLKILIMVNTNTSTTLREIDAKSILKELHNAFVATTTNNPFYVPGTKLNSRYFEKIVQNIFRNY